MPIRKLTCSRCGKTGRHGIATHIKFCAIDPMPRFWAKVNKTVGCWLWTGSKTSRGYGDLTVMKRHVLAHRFSYEVKYGPVPAGMHVLHKCDTPLCVRPSHLFPGTDADNMLDKARKGRNTGSLTLDQVREIKAALKDWTYGLSAKLANKYGVTLTTIGAIKSGRNYGHVT